MTITNPSRVGRVGNGGQHQHGHSGQICSRPLTFTRLHGRGNGQVRTPLHFCGAGGGFAAHPGVQRHGAPHGRVDAVTAAAALPSDHACRFLLHDRDSIFSAEPSTKAAVDGPPSSQHFQQLQNNAATQIPYAQRLGMKSLASFWRKRGNSRVRPPPRSGCG